jgi:hypothetical protein
MTNPTACEPLVRIVDEYWFAKSPGADVPLARGTR